VEVTHRDYEFAVIVTVNPQLAVHRHPLPLPEELIIKLGGGYGFTKTDLADAYNQVKLGLKVV